MCSGCDGRAGIERDGRGCAGREGNCSEGGGGGAVV